MENENTIVLECGKPYKWADICKTYGFMKEKNGKLVTPEGQTKIRLMTEIKSCFEWHHPLHKKGKKKGQENKTIYIFTKKLREPDFSDRRANNGRKPRAVR